MRLSKTDPCVSADASAVMFRDLILWLVITNDIMVRYLGVQIAVSTNTPVVKNLLCMNLWGTQWTMVSSLKMKLEYKREKKILWAV